MLGRQIFLVCHMHGPYTVTRISDGREVCHQVQTGHYRNTLARTLSNHIVKRECFYEVFRQ